MAENGTDLAGLGRRVRERRKALNKTLAALADDAELSPRFVGDVERGRANVSVRGLCQIARALAISPAELLSAPIGSDVRLEAERLLEQWDEKDLPIALEFLRQPLKERPRCKGLALIGLRGAGKTTIGKEAARRTGVEFVELDQRLEEIAGVSLDEIFRIHGEQYYRQLELEALRSLTKLDGPFVVATGGSLVTEPEAFQLLRDHFATCWLKAEAEDHWSRVLEQGDHRPIHAHPSAMTRLQEILQERAPYYSLASHVVDTSLLGLGQSCAAVETLLKSVVRELARNG